MLVVSQFQHSFVRLRDRLRPRPAPEGFVMEVAQCPYGIKIEKRNEGIPERPRAVPWFVSADGPIGEIRMARPNPSRSRDFAVPEGPTPDFFSFPRNSDKKSRPPPEFRK